MRAAALMVVSLLLPCAAQQRAAAPMAMQVRPLPDEAVRQNARLTVNLSPSAKSKVQAAAAEVAAALKRQPKMTTLQLQNAAKASVAKAFPNLAGADIDTVVFIVMMECAQDQQSELQQAMNQMQHNEQAKQAARQQQNATSQQVSDMNQQMQLELQMAMARKSQFEQALSNLMKSVSDAQASIIANLK